MKKHWRAGIFGPFRALRQFLAILVTLAQFVVLSMAFFTFILYKSEFLQIGTIFVVIDVTMKFLLLLKILRNLQTTRGRSFFFILLRNLLFLRHWLAFSFLTQSFHIARKSLVTFAIFAKFADFSKLFLAFSLCKCRIFNCKICYSCYFCHIYYSIFSHSKKKSCYFCEICGLHEALLDLFSL